MLLTIANWLTILRLLISPFFLLIYVYPKTFYVSEASLPFVLLALFLFFELSDAFDGFIARKYEQVTELGKLLDPMADSITRTSAFLTFTLGPVQLPIVIVFIFIYRDTMVGTLRTICALKGFALAARVSGKIKAIIQAIAIFVIIAMMIFHSLGGISQQTLQFAASLAGWIAALYAVYSGIEYFTVNRSYIARMLHSSPR